MRRTLVLLSVVLGACATEDPGPYCPDGFVEDISSGHANGYCGIGSYAEDVETGRGIYGFVKAITGGCGPGDNACSVTYEDDFPVEIYAIDAALAAEDCRSAEPSPLSGDPSSSPIDRLDLEPMFVVTTDDDGRFWTSLPPGSYCVSAIDTVNDARIATAVVVDGELTNATFVFDHGGY